MWKSWMGYLERTSEGSIFERGKEISSTNFQQNGIRNLNDDDRAKEVEGYIGKGGIKY